MRKQGGGKIESEVTQNEGFLETWALQRLCLDILCAAAGTATVLKEKS